MSRTDLIRELVRKEKVHSQDELVAFLAAKGIRTTQATLSRDLRKLQISKQRTTTGESIYVLPEVAPAALATLPAGHRTGDSILRIDFSGQLGVIKTLPGCAGMVGALVDGHAHPGLMGTIAGDDTLLLILRQDASHQEILSFLGGFIPGVGAKQTDEQP